jgi:putative transposase
MPDQLASPEVNGQRGPATPDIFIPVTNAIESLNARYRRAVKARGHFPTEQAALKCLYLVTRSLDPTGTGRTRWAMRWKPALNAFAITFGDRFPAAETY